MTKTEILKAWLDSIAADYKDAAPKASGYTQQNTTVEMREDGGRILVPSYNYWLINGRKPNADQSPEAINHFIRWAGYHVFSKWVKQVGINWSPYAVAWKVAKFGYKQKIDLKQIITDEKKTQLNKSIGSLYAVNINEQWQVLR